MMKSGIIARAEEGVRLMAAKKTLEEVLEDHDCPADPRLGCVFCLTVDDAIKSIQAARREHPSVLSSLEPHA